MKEPSDADINDCVNYGHVTYGAKVIYDGTIYRCRSYPRYSNGWCIDLSTDGSCITHCGISLMKVSMPKGINTIEDLKNQREILKKYIEAIK